MSSPQVNVITDSSVNIILISNVDEKQETENPFLINLRVIFLSLLNLKYLFEIFLQITEMLLQCVNKGLKSVINWARSEMMFIVAHPNERGTNIALIILPRNKASIISILLSIYSCLFDFDFIAFSCVP